MNRPSKNAPQSEHEAWQRYRSCEKKKAFSLIEVEEIVAIKPKYRAYLCEYADHYHLAKKQVK